MNQTEHEQNWKDALFDYMLIHHGIMLAFWDFAEIEQILAHETDTQDLENIRPELHPSKH